MPKKKINTDKEFKLQFTGKASILIELEGYGPLQYRVNDMDTVMEIVRVIMKASDNTTSVDAYDKREQKTFQKILDGIE